MNKNKEYIDELITSFLSGNANEKETEELKAWIKQSAENEEYFMRLQEIWFSSSSDEDINIYDYKNAYKIFTQRVNNSYKKPEASYTSKTSKIKINTLYNINSLYKYAAAIFAFGIISFASYRFGEYRYSKSLADIEVEAPIGGLSRLLLPDSTLVVLNGGSQLKYAQNFGVKSRNVTLNGEGYFEVKRNEKKPFCVESNGIKIKVLGTKFNVQDYPDDKIATVSLMDGKVAIEDSSNPDSNIELIPGERVQFDKRNNTFSKEKYDKIGNDKSWTEGYIVFDETPLKDAVKILSRVYSTPIIISNKDIENLKVYGRFDKNIHSINDIMNILKTTGKINYRIFDKNISIY